MKTVELRAQHCHSDLQFFGETTPDPIMPKQPDTSSKNIHILICILWSRKYLTIKVPIKVKGLSFHHLSFITIL